VSTVGIKTSKDNQLHEELHAQHRPFQEVFKAIEREEAVCEAEQPAEFRENEFKLVLTSPRRLVSTRPGRHQRAQVTELREEHVTLAIMARLRNLSLKILVMMTQKTRETQNKLQLTDQTKRESLASSGPKGDNITLSPIITVHLAA
jgi:hypothetical protein